ncbi:hypothetical protein WMF15_29810 [Sorangium sp. So ce233]
MAPYSVPGFPALLPHLPGTAAKISKPFMIISAPPNRFPLAERLAEDARRAQDAPLLDPQRLEPRLHHRERRLGHPLAPALGDCTDLLLQHEGVAIGAREEPLDLVGVHAAAEHLAHEPLARAARERPAYLRQPDADAAVREQFLAFARSLLTSLTRPPRQIEKPDFAAQRREIKIARQRVVEFVAKGLFTVEDVKAELNRLDDALAAIEAKEAEFKETVGNDTVETRKHAHGYVQQIVDEWSILPVDIQRALIRAFAELIAPLPRRGRGGDRRSYLRFLRQPYLHTSASDRRQCHHGRDRGSRSPGGAHPAPADARFVPGGAAAWHLRSSAGRTRPRLQMPGPHTRTDVRHRVQHRRCQRELRRAPDGPAYDESWTVPVRRPEVACRRRRARQWSAEDEARASGALSARRGPSRTRE